MSHVIRPNRKLLFILNSGNMSRHWVTGMIAGAKRVGLQATWIELEHIRKGMSDRPGELVASLQEVLRTERVGAIVNYAGNGLRDVPPSMGTPGLPRSFWEVRGIPALNLWADHPQWVGDKAALTPEWQPYLRSGLTHHFMKNAAHAYEISRVLGWPNCHMVPCAADIDVLKPAAGAAEPVYDVVAVWGGKPDLPDWTRPFLQQDDPDPAEMYAVCAQHISAELDALWATSPDQLRPALTIVGKKLIELKQQNPRAALANHLPFMEENYPRTMWWLIENSAFYFRAAEILYKFRTWQRAFIPVYLAKYFKVAIFGGDWSHLGIPGGGWVNFADMPKALARGKVSLNIVGGWDEEGLTAKTFEMAAAGVPILHNDCVGLGDCYDIGKEIEVFDRPSEARAKVQALIDSPARRREMGNAIRARTERDHHWGPRVKSMIELAGLPVDAFRA